MEKFEVLDVERTRTTTTKGTNRSSNWIREKKTLASPHKEKARNFESTNNLGKKAGPRPKRKSNRKNYGEKDKEETSSEGKNVEDMDGDEDSPMPSHMPDTFKTKANTLDSMEKGDVGEKGTITSPIRVINVGSQTQGVEPMERVLGG